MPLCVSVQSVKRNFVTVALSVIITVLCYYVVTNYHVNVINSSHQVLPPIISNFVRNHHANVANNSHQLLPNVSNIPTKIFVPSMNNTFPSRLRKRLSGRTHYLFLANDFDKVTVIWKRAYTDFFDRPTCDLPCKITKNISQADGVMFFTFLTPVSTVETLPRLPHQYWIYYNPESPVRSTVYTNYVLRDQYLQNPKFRYTFNWTSTFLPNSDIPTPYGRIFPREKPIPRDVAFYTPSKKTRMAFAVTANCNYSPNSRMEKIKLLQKYIDVDIYSSCGKLILPRKPDSFYKYSEKYRYYLAFENDFCRDYLTEKFFLNSVQAQSVPVVFGGLSRADYEKVAPSSGYVYALDFSTMKQLADFLKSLANNETEYAKYFEWRRQYDGFESYDPICAICEKLMTDKKPHVADLKVLTDPANCRPPGWKYLT